MKKILSLILLSIIAISANAKLTKIDFKWTKMFTFNAIALSDYNLKKGKVGKVEDGKLLIQYKDYGRAGSLCDISIDAGISSFDGSRVTHLEDVVVFYETETDDLIISNKLGQTLLWIINTSDYSLLLFSDIIPFISSY